MKNSGKFKQFISSFHSKVEFLVSLHLWNAENLYLKTGIERLNLIEYKKNTSSAVFNIWVDSFNRFCSFVARCRRFQLEAMDQSILSYFYQILAVFGMKYKPSVGHQKFVTLKIISIFMGGFQFISVWSTCYFDRNIPPTKRTRIFCYKIDNFGVAPTHSIQKTRNDNI